MRAPPRLWVPDFCRLSTLFAVVVGAELVVVILGFAPLGRQRWDPYAFGSASLFAQWVALVSAIVLCKLRVPLSQLRPVAGALLAWAVPVGVAAFGAWLLLRIDLGLGLLLGVPNADPTRFIVRSAAIAGLIGAVALRYAYVQEQWRQQVRAQAKAEVDALQARIRPHFLFNSMNTIASLVRSDPGKAERAVEDLSDLFRAALGAGERDSTLAEEVELVERFLAIEELRLGNRLQVLWQRAEPLPWDLKLPRLVLQPLVENAIIHGIAKLADGGVIDIGLRAEGKTLHVTVGNPCPPADVIVSDARDQGNGHAQQSIEHRLRYRFGPAASMVTRRDDGYYACELRLPL
jgi:two-component system, LytTR family, sensor histidine kinase AlgZ